MGFLSSIWSKVVLVGLIIATIGVAVLRAFLAGKAAQKVDRLVEERKVMIDAKRAEIDANSGSDRDKRLHDRFDRH